MKNKEVKGILALVVVTALSFGVIIGSKSLALSAGGDASGESSETLEEFDVSGAENIEKAGKTADGYLVTVRTKGYVGDIVMDVAFDSSASKITEVKVVEQSETDGLGSKITEPEFLDQFKGAEAPVFLPGMDVSAGSQDSSSEAEAAKPETDLSGLEGAEFTDGTANHSLMVVNVKMSTTIEFGEMQEADGSTIEAPKIENPEKENAATINIPTGGTEENTKIAAVVFEEAREANPATSTQPEASKASVNNVAIKTEPADAVAKEDIIIAIPNPSTDANLGYFDPENMEVESSEAPATRAAAKTVGFNNNNYIITIPQGEKIAGKYSPRVKFTKQAAASVADGYNEVNGKAEVIKIENRDYDALENIILTLKIKNGWDYTVSPAEALKAAGASDALATYINNYIETEEGGTNGSYEIEQKLTASVSGNHVLLYGSKRMVRVKTYTFKVVVGNQSKDVKVELKSYTGHQEEYSNNPVSQHSGGTTGGQG